MQRTDSKRNSAKMRRERGKDSPTMRERRDSLTPTQTSILQRWTGTVKRLARAGSTETGVQKLSEFCASMELLLLDIIGVIAEASVEIEELIQVFNDQLFSADAIAAQVKNKGRRNTRTFATYGYKHVHGHPSLEYSLGKTLGSGTFGVVLQGRHKRTGKGYAIKSALKSYINSDDLWAEVETMKEVDHPHIMRLYASFEDSESIYLAFELCIGGSFFDALNSAGRLESSDSSVLFRQIIGVVSYLHSRKVCHRDLKPENFLVLTRRSSINQCHLKLSDFGTAKRFDLSPLVTKVCTPQFVAPEVLTKNIIAYTEKVDVWACGVILYNMLSTVYPFEGSTDMELLKRIKKGKFEFKPPAVWQDIPEVVVNLVRSMLLADASKRLSADQCFQHEWVQSNGGSVEDSAYQNLMLRIHRFLTTNRLKRVALLMIAQLVGDDSVEDLRNIFLQMDCDNKGLLNRFKVNEGLKNVNGSEMIRAGMVETICQLDPTGDGSVEYTEFLAATMSKEHYLKDDICRSAFDKLDGDADGCITRRDLARLMEDKDGIRDAGLWGTSLGELIDELDRIMVADNSGNGGISFADFMSLMATDEPIASCLTAVEKRRQRGRNSYARGDGESHPVISRVKSTKDSDDESEAELSSLDGSDEDESSDESEEQPESDRGGLELRSPSLSP